jgi:hypothetical protein
MKSYRILGSIALIIALPLGTAALAESSTERSNPVAEQSGGTLPSDSSLGQSNVTPLAFDNPGNFTIGGYLGVGTDSPERAVHLKGSNSVFRMDRSTDSAAFLLVRTDETGQPLKTFVVGVNASGNQGEFIINDLGSAVGGGGLRRMTIDNSGDVEFTGAVRALEFIPTSSLRFKSNIRALHNPRDTMNRLRGVQFDWKATGKPALGLIAEEVAEVLPEVVSCGKDGQAQGVNYDSLVALLVEASKARQREIDTLAAEIDRLETEAKSELKKLGASR